MNTGLGQKYPNPSTGLKRESFYFFILLSIPDCLDTELFPKETSIILLSQTCQCRRCARQYLHDYTISSRKTLWLCSRCLSHWDTGAISQIFPSTHRLTVLCVCLFSSITKHNLFQHSGRTHNILYIWFANHVLILSP